MSEPTKHLDFLVGLLHAIAASHQGNVMLVGNVRAEQIVEICKHTVALTQRAEAAEAERDALRTVYKAAAVYCGDRTVANAHALIDAVGEIRALAVQPTTSTGETQ